MSFPFTHEQLPAINSLARLVRLIAFAGTGKTTTLVGYAQARPQLRILYLCYNKSVEVEAKKRFPPGVVCKTSHGLAYAAFGAKYKHKLATNIRLTDVARIISSQNWDLVRSVLDTLNAFLASADQEIDLCHVPVERLRTERMKRAAGNIVTSARLLWARMCDINDTEARIGHDGYLKAYALTRPDLTGRFDVVMADEAQDINPMLAGLLEDQASYGMGVVVCGDGHQMLYRFRGAVDALEADWLEQAETHYLTQSFRFGPAVATVANMLLHFKGETRPLVGLGEATRVGKRLPEDLEHRTILCRTVIGVIETALLAQAEGEKIYWVGGIDAYNLQDIEDVHSLHRNRRDLVKGKRLLQEYPNFDLYKEIAQESEDSEMQRTIRIVEQYSRTLPELFAKLRRSAVTDELEATLSVSTAHRCKGLEWDYVELAGDFQFEPFNPENTREQFEDEMNLLYVASTRAMKMLAINGPVLEVMQEFVDRRDGRKPDVPLVFKPDRKAA
ncbi:UvrD-helicase domain-containing protein (plasmid) [Pseudomonas aeruginosa]|uniref:UvrD-helicase domain-containing protein n=1 Tax=Pseudomonas aeruginosa TaxID=287 RepID=UPI0021BF4FDD|nr:UvrD-helicase domain-containing protein [Pseudomonas aeruginosa]UXH55919.1 UvrD-helicase domain-containing protein [Pseudomonas aeruginosa]UXH68963.1 UvrD-helicase domain-containing protein [Pseudomonas aeruginosa]